MGHCSKCKTEGRIVVSCRSCPDEICDECAFAEEKEAQMCFQCLDKEEAA